MKRILALCTAALLLLSGCGGSGEDGEDAAGDDDRLSVVTTIFPQYDFVRAIAGDAVELTMLLSPGAESHSYEPTPQDIITIQDADLFIYVGGESDVWVDTILDSMDRDSMEIVALLDIVEAVEEEIVEGMQADHDDDDDDHDDDDDEVELDEHVWTSPKNAIAIVESLTETLSRLDGENADRYGESAEAYIDELEELDAAFAQVVEEGTRSTVVFGDRFPFRYLADAYGLDYFAAFPGCSTETEPSAATVAYLIDKVEDEEIPVVFYIEFSNERMADTICESTGAVKRQLHSCHNLSKDDFEAGVTYLDLMTQNVENLREALA